MHQPPMTPRPKGRLLTLEECDALRIPRTTSVISSGHGRPSAPSPKIETPNSPNGEQASKPESES
jgi:hypothetical protein